MRRRDVASAAVQAGAMGALAAWLTVSFTNPLGLEWAARDSAFVLSVMAVVFYSRLKSMKLEGIINKEHQKLLSRAHPLERLDYVHGEPVQIEPDKITCLLFFVLAADHGAPSLVRRYSSSNFCDRAWPTEFVGLTQESREELAVYEVKGRAATSFQELKEFSFSIAIEDGLMSKEYLVRCDLFDVPQLFIIAKDSRIMWYGDPATKGLEGIVCSALKEEIVRTPAPLTKEAASGEQALAS